MAERRPSRWLAPAVVFGALLILVVLQVLTTPPDDSLQDRPELSSRSTLPYGAQGLYETLGRLGYRMTRRTQPFREPLDSAALYIVLDGQVPVSRLETHALLEAVRRGATLLVSPAERSALADSLGVGATMTFGAAALGPGGMTESSDHEEHDESEDEEPPIGAVDAAPPALARTMDSAAIAELVTVGRRLRAVRGYLEPLDSAERRRTPFPRDTVSFLTARTRAEGTAPVIMGFPLGRGRVVAVGDAFLLANRVVRDGDSPVLLVRAIEWLSPRRDATVVYDEYHHSPAQAEGPGPIARALFHSPLGRAATQLLLAAVLVALALGARPLAPRPRLRTERRSPFEHVGALARAYEQVRATRTVTRRLVQGLRRRHPIGRNTGADAAYLSALAARYPHVESEIDSVRRALDRSLEPAELLAVGHALETIERTIQS